MTGPTGRRRPPRQDAEATRLRLLEAGRELLLIEGSREYIDVRLADACERAGYTTGAAYPIWRSQRRYQEDLARYVVSNFDWAGPESIADEVIEIVASAEGHVDAIRQATAAYFDRFVTQEDFFLALRFWSVREPSSDLAAALTEGYRVVHDGFVELFDGLMAHYGLRFRPPATVDQLTVLLTALVEGLALRHRIDPGMVGRTLTATDGAPSTLFAEGMIAVVAHLTEPIQRNSPDES